MAIAKTNSTKTQKLQNLFKFINSGINISPCALDYLTQTNVSIEKIEQFIQSISYNENNSHISIEPLKAFLSEQKKSTPVKKESVQIQIIKEQGKSVQVSKEPKKKENLSQGRQIKERPPHKSQKKPLRHSKPISKPQQKPAPPSQQTEIAENSAELNNKNEDEQLQKILEEKRKSWEKLTLRQSTSNFTPHASEYSEQINILKNPTNKLFVSAKIEDFLNVQLDKYQKLKAILEKRPEGTSLLDINLINKLENEAEVQFVGMVIEKRVTGTKNLIIQLEDPTGRLTVLVLQKNEQLYKKMQHLLEDHVVIVEGFLKINPERKSRIIIVNNVIFPDTPNTHNVAYPNEDVSICLISDTHFGSVDWMEKVWLKFVDYLNCRVGSDKQIEEAGKIKYLCIAGDLVDGIGIFPNQDKRLAIKSIYKQYEVVAEYFKDIPDYISILITPGDHDAVHKAVPNDAIPKYIATDLYSDPKVKMLGGPALVELHGIKTQLFHGTSLIKMKMSIPGASFDRAQDLMKELIRARHLAPTFGKGMELMPTEKDWLVLDTLPDILHTGHLHKNGLGWYKGILMVNSGTFQAQTDYMANNGIDPDFGKPTIINIKNQKMTPKVIDLING